MGQPDEVDQASYSKGTGSRSCASQSSDDSFILSGSSKESGGSTGVSSWSQASEAQPRSSPHSSKHSSHSSKHSHCGICNSNLNDREELERLIKTAFLDPDRIRWTFPTKTVMLTRDSNGLLGFNYNKVKGQTSGKMHTMVSKVTPRGPAHGRIYIGDCILSANRHHLEGVTLASVLRMNKTDQVCLIIQSPKGIICKKRQSRKPRVQRSISQDRQASQDEASGDTHKQLERMDSSKMSTNSSHASKAPSAAPKSVDERLQALADSGNLSCLSAHMPRLPCLRLVIAGNQAELIASSLVGGAGSTEPLGNDVGVRYRASVRKTCSGFAMEASCSDPKEWMTDLLESVANVKPIETYDRVELEILALKTHPFSNYCDHILATAHSIYIIQFCHQDFLDNKQAVLVDIQKRLNKIRTYASNQAPVYLVVTVEESLPVEQLTTTGKTLHNQFSEAFMNQLQYNPATNFPCFQLVRTQAREQLSNDSSFLTNLSDSEECHISSPSLSGSLRVSFSVRPANTSTHARSVLFDVSKLKEHVSQVAFKQPFITDRYPFYYLLEQDRVNKLKKNCLRYVYKARIMQECSAISSEKELTSLLQFLHNNGDIICADFLEYRVANSFVCFQTTSNNILLDRQHLITAARRLTTIPSRDQQQDPSFTDSMQHWNTLGQRGTASSTFLEYLLGNDSERSNLLTTLSLMNIIHCIQQPDARSASTYLVPYFFQSKPLPTQLLDCYQAPDPSLYDLCVDFHGCLPDGFFMHCLIGLLRKSWETNGRGNINGALSASLSLSSDCQMNMVCDEAESMIKIFARCRVTYQIQDLLILVTRIVDNLKAFKSDLRITVGPSCPLPHYLCSVRASEPGKTHVIDIARGRAPVPIWCGDRQIDQHPAVKRWLIKAADIIQVSSGPHHGRPQVSMRTHIKYLPTQLFNWLCMQLNVPSIGRDWQGIASSLGYKVYEVKVFEVQKSSVFDPCRSLLFNWAQNANATLEALITILKEDLKRMDILVDMQEKWYIVK